MFSSFWLCIPFRSFILFSSILLLLNAPLSFSQEAQAIGRVVSTTGMVTASNEAGTVRELQRRSEIFAGDTITTGLDSFASLRMIDTAQIAFKENTIFTFQTYNTDGPGGAPDNALMNMIQGDSGPFLAASVTILETVMK